MSLQAWDVVARLIVAAGWLFVGYVVVTEVNAYRARRGKGGKR
jgi:hypothetical protein